MRLVFAGTPAPALASLEALLTSRHDVVAVLTRPDAPAGRGRVLRPSPVRERAEAAGIEVLTPTHPSDPEFQARLRALAPECCPVVAYGALVPQPVLDVPVHGWVNLHFSLLPAWRGAAPVQHAVLAGDEVTGATTFRLERGMDTGPVFGVTTEDVRPGDTSGDLLERLAVAGAGLLVHTLDAIEDGTVSAVPQPADGVSLAPKITVEDVDDGFSVEGFPQLDGASGLVLLPDPHSFPTDRVLAELPTAAPGVPVLGGLASGRSAAGAGPVMRASPACRVRSGFTTPQTGPSSRLTGIRPTQSVT